MKQNSKTKYLKIAFNNTAIFSTIFIFGCQLETDKDLFNIVENENLSTIENNNSSNIHDNNIVIEKIDFKIPNNQVKTYPRSLENITNNIDPLYKNQWHLSYLNLANVWKKYTGKNIKIAVVDSGVQWNHPDLYNNIDFNNSLRYSDGSKDSSPSSEQLNIEPQDSGHGTAVAGIIGASGWNSEGVIGIAPLADIVGLNPFSTEKDSDFEDALSNLNIDISSNSWGGADAKELYDDPSSLRGITYGIKHGRKGKGIIYIFASGNEGGNSNYSTLHGSKYVVNIGAIIYNGSVPNYSNHGDNLLITAPAGDAGLEKGIVTTDITTLKYGFNYRYQILAFYNGNYTDQMNGTSSATPVASGVVALILEANPNLTYRDVKYILAKTASKINSTSSSSNKKYQWEENKAGILFSPYYGFGVINPEGAIEMAETFTGLGDEVVFSKSKKTYEPIPDLGSLSDIIYVDKNINVQHVSIGLSIPEHNRISDLKIDLTSPSGTVSNLLTIGTNGSLENWEFNSVKFLDENSSGNWKITVYDTNSSYIGDLREWNITISGYKVK